MGCSNWFLFHDEISKLRYFSYINGYSKELLDEHVDRFLYEMLNTDKIMDKDIEWTYVFTIQFINYPSMIFQRNISYEYKHICHIYSSKLFIYDKNPLIYVLMYLSLNIFEKRTRRSLVKQNRHW